MPPAIGKATRLYGIISLHSGDGSALPAGVGLVAFRDLAGIVAESAYARTDPTADQVNAYRRIVEAVFAQRAILPAPFGTVFRSRDVLLRWLELHYFTLIEALTFVDDRLMVRVRIGHASDGSDVQSESEAREHADAIEASAAESMRVLRRHAVASLVVTPTGAGASSVSTSFLVDRDKWPVFRDVVQEEQKRLPDLRIRMSGPWPPYDFVRMQFGG